MNRNWLVLILVLLLCGCRNQQTPTDTNGESVSAIAVTEPTEPVGFYAPNSLAEEATGGAVKAFPLGMDNVVAIRFLGENILLFSGSETTTLTLFAGETRYIKAQLQLTCLIQPDDPAVLVDTQSITYIDCHRRVLVVLNDRLEEIGQIPLPEDCVAPALSADRKLLYYCASDALRVLDLETGLDRPLREMAFPAQKRITLHCNDTVLQCNTVSEDGSRHTRFFAADTGVLLYENTQDIPLWTQDDFYVALHIDGTYPEWVIGTRKSDPRVLVLDPEPTDMIPIPELHGMLTYRTGEDGSSLLDCYNLELDSKIAHTILPDTPEPKSPQWSPLTNTLWFLCTDNVSGEDVLYAWFLDKSPTTEDDTHLQPRWSAENPDLEGLAQCSLLARQLSIKHGVHVLIWADAAAMQPWDYTLIPEYQVPLLRCRLEELDAILSSYPDGFLEKAASGTGTSRLSICLVRSINGKPGTGALDDAMGLQFWDEQARAYLAITTGADMAQHLNHELFHIIDNRVLSTCNTYDDWTKLNPKGFSYDPQYLSTRSEEGRTFLVSDNRYFIDLYAMSYPKEDRARIMEYAMLEGQAELFQSDPMQTKLRKLCQGIRKAFHLEREATVYLWEQYLDTPLGPIQ